MMGEKIRSFLLFVSYVVRPRFLTTDLKYSAFLKYSSPDIIRQVKSRRMRWAGHVARMGEKRKVYKVLVGKPEGKRPLGRRRHRWEDGIRMNLKEIGLDSTGSGQGPLAGCCECGDEPSGSCATELVSIDNNLAERELGWN
jgi:hypothetical protein